MMEVERLVFVCPDLEETFENPQWERFCISPIRQTRPFLRSRYVIFKNVMLELLQVTNHQDATNFVFFEQWKRANHPAWVGTGCRVDNLESMLIEYKKHRVYPVEEFVRIDCEYKKGFRHRSCLLSKEWCGKAVYLTEYDAHFFHQRHESICKDTFKQNTYQVQIPIVSLTDHTTKKESEIDAECVTLNIFNNLDEEECLCDFGWIVFSLKAAIKS